MRGAAPPCAPPHSRRARRAAGSLLCAIRGRGRWWKQSMRKHQRGSGRWLARARLRAILAKTACPCGARTAGRCHCIQQNNFAKQPPQRILRTCVYIKCRPSSYATMTGGISFVLVTAAVSSQRLHLKQQVLLSGQRSSQSCGSGAGAVGEARRSSARFPTSTVCGAQHSFFAFQTATMLFRAQGGGSKFSSSAVAAGGLNCPL